MDQLPESSELPVQFLAGSFREVTNSYKFYWFLSLLDNIGKYHERTIKTEHLLQNMVASVWYPNNYFRLSFGKQDKLSEAAILLEEDTTLVANDNIDKVLLALRQLPIRSRVVNALEGLGRYVPFRFIRPFFVAELRGLPDTSINRRIESLADQSFDSSAPPLYRFVSGSIEIHPRWFKYLVLHLEVLRSFCLWHLVNYLQKNNPNVPGLVTKLFAPAERDLSEGREFWRLACTKLDAVKCIYSGDLLDVSALSLDHFLPWSYVAHDQLWNIVPTSKRVNSAKGDNLPSLDRYFGPFVNLQYRAIRAVVAVKQGKLTEDYVLLFRVSSATDFLAMTESAFEAKMADTIRPQFQIARNMGFGDDWTLPR